jgi:N-acetylgalactosamine kinase
MVKLEQLLAGARNRDPEIMAALDSVYNIDVGPRLVQLLETFADRFPDRDMVSVLRAPGRVNLIGEHTDYNGLPVMPMAIDYDMMVAVSPRDDLQVRVVNPDFADRNFEITSQIARYETGDWGNYIKAGVQGIVDEFGSVEGLHGFDACFYGSVPVGAGLSSSSTLVVAAAMSTLEVSGREMEPIALAERMASAEWYVGTQGGGMDHAASILSEKGKALKIDFFPLRVTPVTLPEGYTVVVANSLVVSAKTENTRMQYNLRPAVCRMATAMLASKLKLEGENIERLGDIYYLLGRQNMQDALKEHIFWHGYKEKELAAYLGLSMDEINKRFCTTKSGEHIPAPAEGFKVLSRARHVVTEADRVEDSVKALESGEARWFGKLMRQSHRSCRNNYEISHPALDDLFAIGREAGSTGSRLTGAGFGGCTVHLVADAKLEGFLAEVEQRYYNDAIKAYPEAERRFLEKTISPILALRPAGGAKVLF